MSDKCLQAAALGQHLRPSVAATPLCRFLRHAAWGVSHVRTPERSPSARSAEDREDHACPNQTTYSRAAHYGSPLTAMNGAPPFVKRTASTGRIAPQFGTQSLRIHHVAHFPNHPLAHSNSQRYNPTMTLIETDDRSRVVLPGHPRQRFAVQENADGSILLLPARIVTDAQLEYDQSSALRDLLSRAAAAKTVRKRRSPAA